MIHPKNVVGTTCLFLTSCSLAILSSSCVESELSEWRAEQKAAAAIGGDRTVVAESEDLIEVAEATPVEEKTGKRFGFGRRGNSEDGGDELAGPEMEVAIENDEGVMEVVDLTGPEEEMSLPIPVMESEPVAMSEPVGGSVGDLEFKTEAGADGTMAIWLVDGSSGEKMEQLLKKSSLELEGEISPDGNWLVVTDQAFSELQTVHLFKKSSQGSFRKIDRDSFTGTIWDQFSATKIAPHLTIQRWVTEFKGWGSDSRNVDLRLAALPSKGPWIEDSYSVDLNDF